ncbi:MAG: hypothetical protein PHQ27_01295, partial [Victivallales bacterium]|nr:hypothetical protein [Victivallales bacterium]
IPALVDFNNQLKKLGIRLIVVPVPPKLAIYPAGGLAVGEAARNLRNFEAELRDRGIEVLDLTADFIAAKEQGVYCRQDAHWSPAGIMIAAKKLAAAIGLRGQAGFTATERKIKIVGDLMTSLDKNAAPSEELTVREISGPIFSSDSPILVLGDSHTLVFSAGGDMLGKNAGLCEQLAYDLQLPVERIAVKGSASTSVRINLYRKTRKDPDWLQHKKVVIWCFSCREFTESTNGWVKVPVTKKR